MKNEVRPIDAKPLTLDQLREMDGQPVWVKCLNSKIYIDPPIGWRIVEHSITGTIGVWNGESCFAERDYGVDWFAYAYLPAHIDREAWTAEWKECDDGIVMFHCCSKCGRGAIHYNDRDDDFTEKLSDFCPHCGRAMTKEAWDELEKRLRGVPNGQT